MKVLWSLELTTQVKSQFCFRKRKAPEACGDTSLQRASYVGCVRTFYPLTQQRRGCREREGAAWPRKQPMGRNPDEDPVLVPVNLTMMPPPKDSSLLTSLLMTLVMTRVLGKFSAGYPVGRWSMFLGQQPARQAHTHTHTHRRKIRGEVCSFFF